MDFVPVLSVRQIKLSFFPVLEHNISTIAWYRNSQSIVAMAAATGIAAFNNESHMSSAIMINATVRRRRELTVRLLTYLLTYLLSNL